MISALIVTWRADGLVRACLASLLAQAEPPERVRVVISHPGRADPSLIGEIAAAGAEVQVTAREVGYAEAVRQGAAGLPGGLLILNDDLVFHPGCLPALRAARRRHPGAVLQPRLLLPDGRMDNGGHGFFPDGAIWARGRGGPGDQPLPPPGGFSGAAALFPAGLWQEIGGFDNDFDSFCEDVDLSLRLMRRRRPVVYVPAATLTHHLGASYGRADPAKIRRIERNRVRAALRSLPLPLLLAMPITTPARLALTGLLAAAGRGPGRGVSPEGRRAVIAGLWEGLRCAPEAWQKRKADCTSWIASDREVIEAIWSGRARWEDLRRGG